MRNTLLKDTVQLERFDSVSILFLAANFLPLTSLQHIPLCSCSLVIAQPAVLTLRPNRQRCSHFLQHLRKVNGQFLIPVGDEKGLHRHPNVSFDAPKIVIHYWWLLGSDGGDSCSWGIPLQRGWKAACRRPCGALKPTCPPFDVSCTRWPQLS